MDKAMGKLVDTLDQLGKDRLKASPKAKDTLDLEIQLLALKMKKLLEKEEKKMESVGHSITSSQAGEGEFLGKLLAKLKLKHDNRKKLRGADLAKVDHAIDVLIKTIVKIYRDSHAHSSSSSSSHSGSHSSGGSGSHHSHHSGESGSHHSHHSSHSGESGSHRSHSGKSGSHHSGESGSHHSRHSPHSGSSHSSSSGSSQSGSSHSDLGSPQSSHSGSSRSSSSHSSRSGSSHSSRSGSSHSSHSGSSHSAHSGSSQSSHGNVSCPRACDARRFACREHCQHRLEDDCLPKCRMSHQTCRVSVCHQDEAEAALQVLAHSHMEVACQQCEYHQSKCDLQCQRRENECPDRCKLQRHNCRLSRCGHASEVAREDYVHAQMQVVPPAGDGHSLGKQCGMRFRQCYDQRLVCHQECVRKQRHTVEAIDVSECHPKCAAVHDSCEQSAHEKCTIQPEYRAPCGACMRKERTCHKKCKSTQADSDDCNKSCHHSSQVCLAARCGGVHPDKFSIPVVMLEDEAADRLVPLTMGSSQVAGFAQPLYKGESRRLSMVSHAAEMPAQLTGEGMVVHHTTSSSGADSWPSGKLQVVSHVRELPSSSGLHAEAEMESASPPFDHCEMRFRQCFDANSQCHSACKQLVEAEDVTGRCRPQCVAQHDQCKAQIQMVHKCPVVKIEPEFTAPSSCLACSDQLRMCQVDCAGSSCANSCSRHHKQCRKKLACADNVVIRADGIKLHPATVSCQMRFRQCFEERIECHNSCDRKKKELVEAEDVTGKCHPKCVTVHTKCAQQAATSSSCRKAPDTRVFTSSQGCQKCQSSLSQCERVCLHAVTPDAKCPSKCRKSFACAKEGCSSDTVRVDHVSADLVATPQCRMRFTQCNMGMASCHENCLVEADVISRECHPRCIAAQQRCANLCTVEPEFKTETCHQCVTHHDGCQSRCTSRFAHKACPSQCRKNFAQCQQRARCKENRDFVHPIVVNHDGKGCLVEEGCQPLESEKNYHVEPEVERQMVRAFIKQQLAFDKDVVTQLEQLRKLSAHRNAGHSLRGGDLPSVPLDPFPRSSSSSHSISSSSSHSRSSSSSHPRSSSSSHSSHSSHPHSSRSRSHDSRHSSSHRVHPTPIHSHRFLALRKRLQSASSALYPASAAPPAAAAAPALAPAPIAAVALSPSPSLAAASPSVTPILIEEKMQSGDELSRLVASLAQEVTEMERDNSEEVAVSDVKSSIL